MLVSGYGSASDEEGEEQQQKISSPTKSPPPVSLPKDTTTNVLNSQKNNVVNFTLPIKKIKSAPPVEEPQSKKPKLSEKSKSLNEILPEPKNIESRDKSTKPKIPKVNPVPLNQTNSQSQLKPKHNVKKHTAESTHELVSSDNMVSSKVKQETTPKPFFHTRPPGAQLPPEFITPVPQPFAHPYGYPPENFNPVPFYNPNFPEPQFGSVPPWEESPLQKTPSSVLVAGLPTPTTQWQRELEEVDRFAEVVEIDGTALHATSWSNAKKEEVEKLLAVSRGIKPSRTSKRRGQITHLAFESEQRELLEQERRQATRILRKPAF